MDKVPEEQQTDTIKEFKKPKPKKERKKIESDKNQDFMRIEEDYV